MSRYLGWWSIVVCLPLLTPTILNGQNVLPATEGTPQEYAQLRRFSAVVGKLAVSEPGSKDLTLEIQYQVPVVQNPQQLQQLMMQLQSMNRRPMGMMCCCGGKMGYLPPSLTATITMSTGIKKFNLDTGDKLIVRRANLPLLYDDSGKVKKYSQSEISRFKGSDRSKPGYTAKVEDLQPGQFVTVYLAQAKAGSKVNKTERQDQTGNNNPLLPVRMILIMGQTSQPALADSLKK